MKQKITTLLVMMCLFSISTYAQTQFWSDTFEDAGAPSTGTRTPSIAEFSCGGPPATAYFKRTDVAGIALQSGTYTGFQGSKFFAAEDIDRGPICSSNSISANQQVTWSGINISGKTGITFKGLFAANNLNGGFQGTDWIVSNAQDFIAIEYRIDGGSWTKAIGIYSDNPNSSNTFSVDTNGDLLGDGTALTYAFTELEAIISGTGTTLDIRFNCHSNATATQELAVDNFRLFEAPACNVALTPASQTNVACNGGATGAATVNVATGGTAPYTYDWTPGNPTGDGTPSVTGLTAGTWTCTVTDANSCTTSVNFTVTQPTAISLTAASQTNVSCNGGSNGAAAVNTPTGGAGGYTYNWTPGNPTGDGTPSVTGLTAGTWTCTVTDANACTTSVNFTVTQPTAISLTAASQTNVACNGGATGAAAVNAATGGAGGYTYDWTPGNPTGDGTPSVTGLTAGTWTCTVTDANSCTTSVNFTITQPTAISLTAASQTNVSCNGGSNGAAAVNTPTGGAGGYTYNWTPGNPTGDGTPSVTGLTAGTWTCTVTDANSCTTSVNFTITQPTAISLTAASQTNVSCNGGSNGAAAVNTPTGGAGGYTYNWTPGNPTGDGTPSVTGLTAGTWTCTVTDANACTTSVNFTVTQPTAISLTAASQTNVACNGGATGAAAVNAATGGAGGYTYDWTPGNPTGDGTPSVTGLTAGTWTCTVTDANSCTTSVNFTVTQPTALSTATGSQTNVSCNGGSNGSASVTPSGGTPGYTYSWSPSGGTAAIATGLAAGTYTVTVTDANGCTATRDFTITEPTALSTATNSQTNVSCNGGTNGSASVTPSGGTPGYTYSWSPSGGTAATATGLAAGTYTVTVTDANGCTATRDFTITEPTAISLTTTSQTNVSCNGGANGSASVTPSGGTPGYTYSWSPSGGTAATATGLAAGTYTVTVTDANGCTATRDFTITEPTAIDNTISELTTGILTANEVGATYQWYECPNNLLIGETNQEFTPATLGDYRVEVTVGSCTVQSTCFTVTTLGTGTFENKFQFVIYPNPNRGLLNIDSNFDGEFLIVNQLGQTVKTFKVNSSIENSINVESLADGIYYIKGTNGTQISSQKLIIKK